MGINMDIRNEPKYSFLDLRDLDEADKNEIAEILRLDTSLASLKLPWDIGEKEYEIAAGIAENPSEDATVQWQQYSMPEGMTGYEVQAAPMMAATMTSAHQYSTHPQMIYTVGDYPPMGNLYTSSGAGDPNPYTYDQRLPYAPPPTIYSSNQPELMNQAPPSRENDRRGQRNRSGKRGDSYNRQMNTNNEMHAGYIVQGQYQYGQILPMCHTSGGLYPVSAQSHPAAGTPIFIQPSPASAYPQAPQMHHNSHPSYSHHQSSYTSHGHPSSNTKYVRNSTGQTTYYNQDGPKNLHKHYDKRANQQQDPPYRHPINNNNNNNHNNNNNNNNKIEEAETPKRNYGKTLIVNNSATSFEAVNNSPQTPPRQSDTKKVTILQAKLEIIDASKSKDEHKEEIKEKKDIAPPAAPNNDNNNAIAVAKDKPVEKEVPAAREDKVPPMKIPAENANKPPAKVTENIVVENNETSTTTKIAAQEIAAKTAESSPVIAPTVPSVTNVSASPSTESWANILKKKGTSGDVKSPTPITKLPVACVPPISFSTPPVEPIAPKTSSSEIPPRNDNGAGNRNSLEATMKNTENSASENKTSVETPQNHLNDPAVFRMGELLIKYQMDKQTVSLLPRGLTNRSNYCYINSILQALLACPPFYNLLMALPHPRNSMRNSATPLIDNMVRFVREFNPLSEGARMPRKDKSQKRGEETAVDVQCGVAFEPSYVYTMLKNTSCAGGFSVEGRQEDAEEFLSCLLNGISDEMLELMKLVNSESNDKASDPTEANVNFSSAEEGWKVMGPKNKGSITRCTEFGRTPLSDIFRGQLRSRVLRTGDETTDNVQPFFTLQLDIEKAESVEAALEILVGKDQVEGMTCSKTKQQIEAWKQVLLEELPIILILHLKWFDYKLDGCSKIFKRVGFPIDLKLDGKLLSPNVAKKLTRKQKQYKLFAVTYHDGKEASKGHYVTDAFHVGYNAWVRYDDSSVKGIYEMDVLNPSPPRVPYLLYYRRCDTIGNNPPITTRTR